MKVQSNNRRPTSMRGELHPMYKNVDVVKMHLEIKNGRLVKDVCKEYGISEHTFRRKKKALGIETMTPQELARLE